MLQLFHTFTDGLEAVLFPATCMACGTAIKDKKRVLCSKCVNDRFEDPNPANRVSCTKMLLPDGINFQDALWRYDKEGHIQEMIRCLKYQGMSQIGTELGKIAGKRITERHLGTHTPENLEEILLLPVPLHPAREKKRGYNQARMIASGMSEISGVDLAENETVVRTRNTLTQTKFSFSKRMENLKGVFKVNHPEKLKDKFIILVDDVFTTGSTCYSMAASLKNTGVAGIGILTIGIA